MIVDSHKGGGAIPRSSGVMRDLHEMDIGQRVTVTVIIVVVIMLLLAVISYLSGRWEVEAQAAAAVVPSKWDDQIDELERQALGEAFKKHIVQLYSIWVTDNYQPKIPPKALTGARNARDAYIRSMEAIEKREQPPRKQL